MIKSKVFELIQQEEKRQREGLEMIPSENYASKAVLTALGSVLTNKYSEGYPKARYYSGNAIIDELETYTKNLANKLFGTIHANVQPYSGSPANLAVLLGLLNIGDTIMGLKLSDGGHLTHGAEVSFSGKLFKVINYPLEVGGRVDLEQVEKLALKHQPKLMWVGTTAYPFKLEFEQFSQIAEKVRAYLVADISHVVGLVIGGVHPDPVPFVDVITTTTHKTLRGPRGAMILVTQKGLDKDPDLPSKIDKAVFPGLQGGPHDNQMAALAIALEEASSPKFKKYAAQVIKNAKVLAEELGTKTENHLILWNLSKYGFGLGYQLHLALEQVGIYVNKNAVPGEKASPFYPSGIRLGTPTLTSRGMKEEEMKKIANWIMAILEVVKGHDLPKKLEERREFIKTFRQQISDNKTLKGIKKEVQEFASQYPVPGIEEVT